MRRQRQSDPTAELPKPQTDEPVLQVDDLPFVIREHARKFQLVNAQATLWQKSS